MMNDRIAPVFLPLAVVLLVVWAGVTFSTEAPGWIHALLTAGVFLLIYGVVRKGTAPKD